MILSRTAACPAFSTAPTGPLVDTMPIPHVSGRVRPFSMDYEVFLSHV